MSQSKEENTLEIKYQKMTETPIKKLIIQLAIPTMISMMITSIYNMADTYFVGQLSGGAAGTSATGAVSVAFPLMAIIQAIGFMFGHGSGNFVSRALGRHELDEANKMVATGFFSALIGGTLLFALGMVFLEPLVRLLGATPTIFPYALSYIRIILCGAPWMTASLVLNNQLRFQGNAFFAMIGITSGGLLNIALDPLFIFVFDMGISGAALATIISQLFSFILLLLGARKSDNLKIKFRNFTPKAFYFAEIFKGGAPSLVRQGIGSVATACLNIASGNYGDAAIAAMGIVSRVMMFANSLVIGFGQGFQPVCGFNYGAKKFSRVREGFRFCVVCTTLFLCAAAVVGFIVAPEVIAAFRKGDADVIAIGTLALKIQCITLPTFGFVMISNMMMQTLAQTVRASLVAMARQGLFFLPLILTLPSFFGLFGVQITQPIADVLTFVLAVYLQLGLLQKVKREEAALQKISN